MNQISQKTPFIDLVTQNDCIIIEGNIYFAEPFRILCKDSKNLYNIQYERTKSIDDIESGFKNMLHYYGLECALEYQGSLGLQEQEYIIRNRQNLLNSIYQKIAVQDWSTDAWMLESVCQKAIDSLIAMPVAESFFRNLRIFSLKEIGAFELLEMQSPVCSIQIENRFYCTKNRIDCKQIEENYSSILNDRLHELVYSILENEKIEQIKERDIKYGWT